MPAFREVIHAQPHRLPDVRADARRIRKPLGARPDQYERHAGAAEIVDIVRHRIDDRALDPRLPQGPQMAELTPLHPVRRENEERGALLGHVILRAAHRVVVPCGQTQPRNPPTPVPSPQWGRETLSIGLRRRSLHAGGWRHG